jgi:hypothetical protein
MNSVNNFFDSRNLFYNKHPLSGSEQTRNMLRKVTGERQFNDPIAEALLNLGSALFCYNSYTRFYTQRFVAIENCIDAIIKMTSSQAQVEKREWDGLIYTLFWLSGHQELGEALAILRDLSHNLPIGVSDFRYRGGVERILQVTYDLTYLGFYLSPQGRSLIILLKISKVAYFVFNEGLKCHSIWSNIQTTRKTPHVTASVIKLLANVVHLYGNSLQLYTEVTLQK